MMPSIAARPGWGEGEGQGVCRDAARCGCGRSLICGRGRGVLAVIDLDEQPTLLLLGRPVLGEAEGVEQVERRLARLRAQRLKRREGAARTKAPALSSMSALTPAPKLRPQTPRVRPTGPIPCRNPPPQPERPFTPWPQPQMIERARAALRGATAARWRRRGYAHVSLSGGHTASRTPPCRPVPCSACPSTRSRPPAGRWRR